MCENQQFAVPTMFDTNRSVQSEKQARFLKFWIEEEEKLYYLCSEADLISSFVFAYANCWFSHAVAMALKQL